jgi:hypothetical protein
MVAFCGEEGQQRVQGRLCFEAPALIGAKTRQADGRTKFQQRRLPEIEISL